MGTTTKTAVLCPGCGPIHQEVAASRMVENTSTHVVTCVRLSCGHVWHRTIRNIGGIFPGSPRNVTFALCDCPPGSV